MASDGHLCYLCSEIFDEPSQLQEHLLADHDIQREEEEDIECIQSDEEIELYDPLPVMEDDDIEDEFLLDVTSLEVRRAASYTNKPVSNPIQVHYKQIIQGQSQVNSEESNKSKRVVRKQRTEWYQCDQCDFKTKTKGVLKTHKLTHTFDCVLCPFKTVIPDALQIHINRVHCGEPQKTVHVIHQPQQQQHLPYSFEPRTLENEAELREDEKEANSVNQFILLDSNIQTDVSQRENLQVHDSGFSYLNTARKSVIINLQDSELIQNAYTFLQSKLDSDTSQLL